MQQIAGASGSAVPLAVPYLVVFRRELDDVPAEIRTRLRRSLEEVGRAIDVMPPDSGMMQSVVQSPMQLDVSGWRFFYKLDTDNSRLLVTSAVPAPSDDAARDSAKQ